MTDQYLQEQHAYAMARSAAPDTPRENQEPDERTSWVMLTRTGTIHRLPHEHIIHTTGARVSLDLTVPRALQDRSTTPFSLKSENGTTYITTQRVIYLPAKPTETFKSFAAPVLNFEDSHISSPWFGSWYWCAHVTPVSQGGIPPEVARVELKLTFKDGGHNEFQAKFEELKERLYQIRESGQRLDIPDEPLPAYEGPRSGSGPASASGAGPGPGPAATDDGSGRLDSTTNRGRAPAPDEPPPDYDEAQAQTISMRLEDHIRDAVGSGRDP